jgi:hypothetical protein
MAATMEKAEAPVVDDSRGTGGLGMARIIDARKARIWSRKMKDALLAL